MTILNFTWCIHLSIEWIYKITNIWLSNTWWTKVTRPVAYALARSVVRDTTVAFTNGCQQQKTDVYVTNDSTVTLTWQGSRQIMNLSFSPGTQIPAPEIETHCQSLAIQKESLFMCWIDVFMHYHPSGLNLLIEVAGIIHEC